MSPKVKTRFAPSPTGFLHVGGARTALFNWLHARTSGGTFLLRIEDTDEARHSEASVEQILDSLTWLGLTWDEGPYFQSQRLDIYREHLERLRLSGSIYPAFETMEELEAMRALALKEKRNPIYDRRSLRLPASEIARRLDAGENFVWRFRVPDEGATEVPETLMQGAAGASFENAAIGDFAITRPGTLKAPGMPLYNFVCTVDDALMGITHVIRGVEHLSNAPKQILLYQALGFAPPTFTHLPLIMKGAKKMSKRDADADPRFPVSVSARRDLGYLPEATVNFLALMGWSHPEALELFSREELIASFGLDRLSRSNANFDEDKYLHHNGWYIRHLELQDLVARVRPFLEKAGLELAGKSEAWLAAVIGLEAERSKLLSDFAPALDYFFAAPTALDPKGVKKFLSAPEGAARLETMAALLEKVEPFERGAIEAAVRALSETSGLSLGALSQPVRLALTGRTFSPGLFEVLELIGRDESLSRLRRAPALAAGA